MLEVSVLGPVEVRRDGLLVPVPGGKTAELLVRLALEAGRPVRADRLVDDLWAQAAVTTRRNTLQSKVARLRRALGDPLAIASGDGAYALAVEPSAVDALVVLGDAVDAAALLDGGDDRGAAELAASASKLFRGDVLPAAGDWVAPYRARLDEARMKLVETRCAARLALGDGGDVIGELEAAVAADGYRERLWELLITALYRAGRQADALAAYRRVRSRLADDLGLDPGPQLRRLEQQILVHDPALRIADRAAAAQAPGPPEPAAPTSGPPAPGATAAPTSGPPPEPGATAAPTSGPPEPGATAAPTSGPPSEPGATAAPTSGPPAPGATATPTSGPPPAAGAAVGNLPSMAADLVGREPQVAAVSELLASTRLVEIVGPGGIGKTALALAVGRRLAASEGAPPGGVWLARLETATTADEILDALIAAMSVTGGDGALLERLKGAAAVVILDNCEHVVDAAAALATRLLDAAPRLRILCTSQVALEIDGEAVFELTPLALADAVELFTRRAAARRGDRPTAEAGDEVRDLCRSLDGLPLAIELAAARTRTLSVADITRRLDDRFSVLSDPASRRPQRRRALKATIGWSYELLFPDDQRGLWALATFAGGAPLPAVEAVLEALGVPASTAIDVVERLASRSLVIVDDDRAKVVGAAAAAGKSAPAGGATADRMSAPVGGAAAAGKSAPAGGATAAGKSAPAGGATADRMSAPAGAPRYRLLDSIRAFALEAMADAGLTAPALAAHAAWVAEAGRSSTQGVRSARQAEHLAFARAERANIDAALAWSVVHDPLLALHLVNGFGWAWIVLGDSRGAQRILTALGAAGDAAPIESRAQALLLAAWIEASTGRLELAREHVAAATELAEAIGDVDLQARSCYYLAYVVSHHGEFARALELTDRARALYDGLDRPWDQAATGLFATRAAISAGNHARAAEARDRVEHWLRTVDDPWLHVRRDAMLGELARIEHRFDDAVVHIGRAAATSGRLGFLQTEAYQLSSLGRAQCQAGDYVAGAATLEGAIAKAEATGDVRLAALARVHLGRVLRALGRTAPARTALEAATAWHRAAGGGELAALGECLLAALDAEAGASGTRERRGAALDAEAGASDTRQHLDAALDAEAGASGARQRLGAILDAARREDDAPVEVFALDALARIAAEAGDPATAAELCEAADRRMQVASHFITDLDRTDARAVRQIA